MPLSDTGITDRLPRKARDSHERIALELRVFFLKCQDIAKTISLLDKAGGVQVVSGFEFVARLQAAKRAARQL
jgi:hypothetical protein